MTLEQAVQICKLFENYAPLYGFHIALTGGCLYKDGDRKDLDIVFYKAEDEVDLKGLLNKLCELGLGTEKNDKTIYGDSKLIMSGIFKGTNVDCFFPGFTNHFII